MPNNEQSLMKRITIKINAFNQRLEAKLRRNQNILENMRAEENFRKNMGYMKTFFRLKGGN